MTGIEILDLIGKYAGIAVTTFVAGGVGAYLGSYLKKKAENFATHEDIGKLVEQMAAVTQTTKEIEAKISNDVWSRQKRWEVQQTALLGTLRDLAAAESLVYTLLHEYAKVDNGKLTLEEKDRRELRNREFMNAIHSFWQSKLATGIVCGKRIADQLDKIDHEIARVRLRAQQGSISEAWDIVDTIQREKGALGVIIREEMGFGPLN
jgi:hypothetical protein